MQRPKQIALPSVSIEPRQIALLGKTGARWDLNKKKGKLISRALLTPNYFELQTNFSPCDEYTDASQNPSAIHHSRGKIKPIYSNELFSPGGFQSAAQSFH